MRILLTKTNEISIATTISIEISREKKANALEENVLEFSSIQRLISLKRIIQKPQEKKKKIRIRRFNKNIHAPISFVFKGFDKSINRFVKRLSSTLHPIERDLHPFLTWIKIPSTCDDISFETSAYPRFERFPRLDENKQEMTSGGK